MWHTHNPKRSKKELGLPIILDDLHDAVRKGKRKNAPGPDGICLEFYKKMWDIIKNELLDTINIMYLEGRTSDAQKQRYVSRLPKIGLPARPKNYRPLKILNTDYKILTRILANRLRLQMEEVLHHN